MKDTDTRNHVYVNASIGEDWTDPRRRGTTPTPKNTDTRNHVYVNASMGEDWTDPRRNKTTTPKKVTAALVLLLILFLILAAITSVLLKYYLDMKKDISHLKNPESICTPCPAGWSMSGCSCYFVSEVTTSWVEARDDCYKKNAALVMIKDKAESDTLNKLYKMNRRYWIGLRRDPEAGTWKWLDGTEIIFNNWGMGQPDNYMNRSEDCGETKLGVIDSASWNDRTCAYKIFYICKR